MTPEQAAALRQPFPKSAIGKLPKGGTQLDYVGHAATTDRLLAVDPEWSWEPVAFDEQGLPAFQGRNLWIRLTVAGITRYGVGDGGSVKECIGDAIRNAAMRFGVALDLWSKEELEQAHGPAAAVSQPPPRKPATKSPLLDTGSNLAKAMYAAIGAAGITKDETPGLYREVTGHVVESSKELTDDEARAVLAHLDRIKDES
jgi:hypothetical protein